MKKIIYSFKLFSYSLVSVFVMSCVHESKQKDTDVHADSVSTTSGDTIVADPISWMYDAAGDSLVREHADIGMAMNEKILHLNNRYDGKVVLDLVREGMDTVFVKIDDAAYLTQQMGSSSAYGYMAVVTYTLSEGNGVKYVNFDFIEGDHASPGTYSRNDFDRH